MTFFGVGNGLDFGATREREDALNRAHGDDGLPGRSGGSKPVTLSGYELLSAAYPNLFPPVESFDWLMLVE